MKGSLALAVCGRSAVPETRSTPASFRGCSCVDRYRIRRQQELHGMDCQLRCFVTMQIPIASTIASRTPESSDATMMRSMVVRERALIRTHRETQTKSKPLEETDT